MDRHLVSLTALLALLLSLACIPVHAAEGRTGEQIYRQQCASCHGAAGEGTPEEYPDPLIGDRPLAELTELISKTMPKDAPQKCVGEDARLVAAYIFDAFYSEAAQARNKPPRIELSRLTVPQYRNVVADLVGSFGPPAKWDDARGLRGEYYKSRRFRGNDRVLERVDPQIGFDFGTSSPDEKLEAHQFSIRWEGSLLAPETGEYEFIVRTEHAARLWINQDRGDSERPLIDAWVKSGSDTEYRQSLFLLGGRFYPLRLEFSKAKQGVDDSKKQKEPPPAVQASIALEWKLPRRAAEVIPQRNLSPQTAQRVLAVTTPFPPDDRSVGYERGASISKAWDQATTDAAIEVAGYVVANLRELSGAKDDAPDRRDSVRDFCRQFAERAFRRPLSAEQQQLYVDRHFEDGIALETAVKRVVLLVLKSPRFLYTDLVDDPQLAGYAMAERLSLAMWDSLPDKPLLDAAAAGELTTPEQVKRQAERMAGDFRARWKLREFFLGWVRADHIPELSKDSERYPEFTDQLASDLRTSLELFLEDIVTSETADFRQLLLADQVFLNGRLAEFYGAKLPAEAPFQKVAFEPGRRAGVLTHPFLLAGFAYTSASSPIHRGVFIARSVLGRTLAPPPEAVSPLPPELHAGLSTRERVALQTGAKSCQTCHSMINPLGFTLEHFDAVGRYRERDNEKLIDATGSYLAQDGQLRQFTGVLELASFLAQSEEVHAALVEQLFHHLVKQPVRAFGPETLANLQTSFREQDFNLRRLMVEIVAVSALRPEATAEQR